MTDSGQPPQAPESASEQLGRTRQRTHPHCIVCGPHNLAGLHLHFSVLPDGAVQAEFECQRLYEGYPDTLHGGVICSLLDGAMTNCLFAHGRTALTGEITVRFLHPVVTERHAIVRAWIEHSHRPLYHMAADLRQCDEVMATATAKFVEQLPADSWKARLRGRRSSS
jgi:acyl-coenzyme A thioesterase PaaI-like protein